MFKFKNTILDVMRGNTRLATIRRLYDGPEHYRIDFDVDSTTKAIKEGLDEFAIDGWVLMDLGHVPTHLIYKGPEAPNIIWDRTPDKESEDAYLMAYDDLDIDPETREYDRLEFLARYYHEGRKDEYGIWFRRVE